MSAIRNVEIIDFYFFPGIKGPRVRAMAKIDLERVSETEVMWFDLLPDETEALIQIAQVVERRLMTSDQPASEPPPATKRPIGFEKPPAG